LVVHSFRGYRSSDSGVDNATVIAKRTGNVEELTWNFDGENVKGRSVVSPNGKTATYTATGTEKGHPLHNVELFRATVIVKPKREAL
jgi:hypothetical protein